MVASFLSLIELMEQYTKNRTAELSLKSNDVMQVNKQRFYAVYTCV